ncbi:MAG: hypothetical protein ACTSRG_21825 [Candidatus Helarchaeota archaeon]
MTQNFGVKAVVISDANGIPIVVVKTETNLDETLMSSFLSAVGTFSEEVLGGACDIFFKANDLDLYCFFKKYEQVELKIFALMDSNMKKLDIRGEAEAALDGFIDFYGEETIKNWNNEANVFKLFENALQEQINLYYSKIDTSELNKNNKKEGFFSRLLKRIKLKK